MMSSMKFSIRDLLWATALCAVLVAWRIDHESLLNESGYKFSQRDNIIDVTKKRAAMEKGQLEYELQEAQRQLAEYERLSSQKASPDEN